MSKGAYSEHEEVRIDTFQIVKGFLLSTLFG
jgi:hypothetical protein